MYQTKRKSSRELCPLSPKDYVTINISQQKGSRQS